MEGSGGGIETYGSAEGTVHLKIKGSEHEFFFISI
jgi:hypothetical protein